MQDDGLGVYLVEKGLGKTLQERSYLMQVKVTQLSDIQFAILAYVFPQLNLMYNLSTKVYVWDTHSFGGGNHKHLQ